MVKLLNLDIRTSHVDHFDKKSFFV